MKKFILGGIAVLAIAAAAVVNVNLGSKGSDLSALSLANVEALAHDESSCCIGSQFKIEPIEGGWRCVNNQGNSCCPIC